MSSIIYKILRPAEWKVAATANEFAGAPVDLADGFIHFSTATQVEETAKRHFSDTDRIFVLAIGADQLPQGQLKWEKSRGGELFPHLYGPLPMASVSQHWQLERTNGTFEFSEILKDTAP